MITKKEQLFGENFWFCNVHNISKETQPFAVEDDSITNNCCQSQAPVEQF
jgi:hypothetical protein